MSTIFCFVFSTFIFKLATKNYFPILSMLWDTIFHISSHQSPLDVSILYNYSESFQSFCQLINMKDWPNFFTQVVYNIYIHFWFWKFVFFVSQWKCCSVFYFFLFFITHIFLISFDFPSNVLFIFYLLFCVLSCVSLCLFCVCYIANDFVGDIMMSI